MAVATAASNGLNPSPPKSIKLRLFIVIGDAFRWFTPPPFELVPYSSTLSIKVPLETSTLEFVSADPRPLVSETISKPCNTEVVPVYPLSDSKTNIPKPCFTILLLLTSLSNI